MSCFENEVNFLTQKDVCFLKRFIEFLCNCLQLATLCFGKGFCETSD